MRVKKVENGQAKYYLRSSILGGQVIAEINQSGGWTKGFVYGASGELLAIQEGAISFVHQDPVTKSQRITNASGGVASGVDLDPWGGETNKSFSLGTHARKYTTYDRDANGDDEAQQRKYKGNLMRFTQPDPFDGSASLADPQSLNRYAYVQNDPVNFVDPSGLNAAGWGAPTCYVDGFQRPCSEAYHLFETGAGMILPDGAWYHQGNWWVDDSNLAETYNDRLRGQPFVRYEFGLTQDLVGGKGYDCGSNLLVGGNLRDESSTTPILPYIHRSVAQDFQNALNEINAVVPGGIGFTEVFRTRAIQEGLYANRGRNSNPVAKPGTSRHESGFAFDVKGMGKLGKSTDLARTIIPIFKKHGFDWGGSFGDQPHFQADPEKHGYANRAAAIADSSEYYQNCINGR